MPSPPPASSTQGYPMTEGQSQDSGGVHFPGLECHRHKDPHHPLPGTHKGYPHPRDCQQEMFTSAVESPFPHLYREPTTCIHLCHTPHGSQYNLATQCQASGCAQTSPQALSSPTQSLPGTLTRGSKKIRTGASCCGGVAVQPHSHYEGRDHKPTSGTCHVDSAIFRRGRTPGEVQLWEGVKGEIRPWEDLERAGEESGTSTPNSERKSKRESAV